ncbi:adenylate/guanylate cyclase domain-containing protein [Pseudomonas aeruginosa]|nr:adenylate/guanylate cyclase domain-containing protein [Pseudomonas aeruginosa]
MRCFRIIHSFWDTLYSFWFDQQEDLYHERYSSIAVMFASIPNYKEFYDETDVNKQGLECLRLLNEIICDFDKVNRPLVHNNAFSLYTSKVRLKTERNVKAFLNR